MSQELANLYASRTVNFEFACDLLSKAQTDSRKLDLGEKVFIVGAVRDALLIPAKRRSEGFDILLKQMLAIGVCEYTHIPPGSDKVVDYFYENPQDATDDFKRIY
ncbi:Uncharacterised protein [uncultured archaeon]|nr:Uncharacterised protein [uncultured archaeon]